MRELPIGLAFGHMFSSTVRNLGFALRAQWPWLVVMGATFALVPLLSGANFMLSAEEQEKYFTENPDAGAAFVLTLALSIAVALIAFSSIAVSWHRYILLDEMPKGLAVFRLDNTVWRYLGNLFLIGLVGVGLMLPVSILFGSGAGGSLPVFFALLLTYITLVVVPVFYRLSIKLPAIALDRRDFTFGNAWEVSKGNWLRIVGLAVLMTLISWISGSALAGFGYLLVNLLGQGIGGFVSFAIQMIVNWIITIMGITVLTSLYGFFVEGREF